MMTATLPMAEGSARRPPGRSVRRRGSVILFVLITMFFAAMAIAKFVERASLEMLTEGRASDASACAGRRIQRWR